jgi:hypothetical protein
LASVLAAMGLMGCAHRGPTVYVVSDIDGTYPVGELHGRQIFTYDGDILSVQGNDHVRLRSLQDFVLVDNRLYLTNQPNMVPGL